MPINFLVIKLCQLSMRSPIRNLCMLLYMADFTREFTMFTTQCKLANRNFAVSSICRNEQQGFFIAGVLSFSTQFPCLQRLLCKLLLPQISHHLCPRLSPNTTAGLNLTSNTYPITVTVTTLSLKKLNFWPNKNNKRQSISL